MALAVTHVIGTIFILDILRHYVFKKHRFPRYLVVIGGIAGLAPDIDIPLGWLTSLFTGTTTNLHGAFTHSIFFVVLLALIGVIFHYKENAKWRNIFYVVAAGWFFHILLDCGFNAYSTFLWPLSFDTKLICPERLLSGYRSAIDAVILVAWLINEEIHNNIRDYT